MIPAPRPFSFPGGPLLAPASLILRNLNTLKLLSPPSSHRRLSLLCGLAGPSVLGVEIFGSLLFRRLRYLFLSLIFIFLFLSFFVLCPRPSKTPLPGPPRLCRARAESDGLPRSPRRH